MDDVWTIVRVIGMCIGRVFDDVWTTVTGHRSEQSPVIGPNSHRRVGGKTGGVPGLGSRANTYHQPRPAVLFDFLLQLFLRELRA